MAYIWSKREPDEQVMFYFGIRFRSAYLPLALLLADLIFEESLIPGILGIICGHIYIFLVYIYPLTAHKNYLKTPNFLYTKVYCE
jgi:hypothetical protein